MKIKIFRKIRLNKMLNKKSWECLFADENKEKIKPYIIYKQYWKIRRLLNKHF